jgi:hypothetical protein
LGAFCDIGFLTSTVLLHYGWSKKLDKGSSPSGDALNWGKKLSATIAFTDYRIQAFIF